MWFQTRTVFLTLIAILAFDVLDVSSEETTSTQATSTFAGAADLVTDPIPGFVSPKDLNLVHYSGFLDSGNGVKLHYWFFESLNSSVNNPLVLWLNGGPGCSSMLGALAELGPLRLQQNGQV